MAILRSGRADIISMTGTKTCTVCTHISAEVCIFGISPVATGLVSLIRALVDSVHSAKRIDVFLGIGKGPVREWLERHRVAAGSRVRGVDRGRHRV